MSRRSFWDISFWDTGAGTWQKDSKIPRSGLETFSRLNQSTLEFIELASGDEVKLSSETKNKWGEIILTFPKQVVTESIKSQFINYINNENGIRITIPIITGASLYTEKIIEGYPITFEESWELDDKTNIRNIVRLTVKEFNVSGS
jgi:hypothetical protein